MKHKIIVFFLIVITLFLFCNVVEATPGALRGSSIKTCPNGITYGLHSDGHGGTHWHEAAKNGKNQYYPTGETTYYDDPCPKSTKNEGTAKNTNPSNNNESVSNNNNNNNYSNQNNVDYNSNANNIETQKVEKTISDATIKSVIVNKIRVDVSDNMECEVYKKEADITITTNNPNAKYEIEGQTNNLPLDEPSIITVKVEAEDGTIKNYTLQITREKIESDVRITSLSLNDSPIDIGYSDIITDSVLNNEDKLNLKYKLSDSKAKLVIKKDDQIIENGDKLEIGKNYYKLVIIDQDENEKVYNLTIERMSKADSFITVTVGTSIFAILILVIAKKIKKKH